MGGTISVCGPGRGGRLIGRIAGAGIAVAVSCLVPSGAMAAVRGGTWGNAQQVPGVAGHGDSGVVSMSCASPGNCGAGGFLPDGVFGQQAFVVSEKNGIWGKAEVVQGSVALDTGQQGQIDSVSCASPGNCSAGGLLSDGSQGAFVVSQKNGAWGKAEKVPGLAALTTKGRFSEISSVSCGAPGDCSAGGGLPGPRFPRVRRQPEERPLGQGADDPPHGRRQRAVVCLGG